MLKTLAALAVIGTAGSALAQDEAPATRDRFVYTSNDYISVLGGVALPDSGRGTATVGGHLSFLYGNQVHENVSVEGRFSAALLETGKRGGSDFYQYSGGIDVAFSPYDRRDEHAVTPFALIGIVAMAEDASPNTRDDNAFGGNVGLGLVTAPLLHNLRLRAEGRYTYSTFESGYHDFSLGFGLEIPIGRVREKLTTIPAKIETKIVEIEKPVPRPIIDTDGDTVEDAQDTCPNTAKGVRVDAAGCVLPGQLLELRPVTFEPNELKIRPNAQSILDVIARGLVAQPTLRLEIGGHSDLSGSAAKNKELSRARAESVRTYLLGKGVKAEQLTVVAYGISQPKVKPEKNADDRTLNRRVEFRILGR
jgi:OOP family OmpA-OmpF porin